MSIAHMIPWGMKKHPTTTLKKTLRILFYDFGKEGHGI